MNYPRKKIVEKDILIVKPHQSLDLVKSQPRIRRQGSVMKTVKQTLQLRNDGIFIVTRVANECAGRVCSVPRQIRSVWVAPRNLVADQKCIFPVVHIRLVVRTTSVYVVEIERWRSEIRQSVRIILHLQATRRIERNVMIDELAQVRIERRNTAFFGLFSIRRGIELCRHRCSECT